MRSLTSAGRYYYEKSGKAQPDEFDGGFLQQRGATVVAAMETVLLRLPRATFDQALTDHPEMGLGLLSGLTRLLRQSNVAPRARRASLQMHMDSKPGPG